MSPTLSPTVRYTYIFADLLTNAVLGQFPCYGVYFDRELNKSGNLNASIFVGAMNALDRKTVWLSTIPAKTAIYVDRDGTLVWGGVVWSRTYQSQAMSVQMTAQTFDSYLFKRVNTVRRVWKNIDKRNVARDLVNFMQAEAFSNIGITVPDVFPTQFPTTRVIESWDYVKYGDYIADMAGEDNGFDWTIEAQYNGNEPSKILRMGSPLLGLQRPASGLVFAYPVGIPNYYWSESGSKSVTNAFAIGSGEGKSMLVGTATDGGLANVGGFPRLDGVSSHKDVTIKATINEHAMHMIHTSPCPVESPTIETRPDQDPEFGSYGIGSEARFLLDDKFRWEGEPAGTKDTWRRIVGWTVRPQSSEGTEQVQLLIQSEEVETG